MDTGVILQGLNGMLAPTALWAFFIFARYMYYNMGLKYEELRPVVAMMALCGAETILRAPVFALRIESNLGHESVRLLNWAYIWGGVGVMVGFLCIIRVFSPMRWGVWSWIVPLTISTIVTGASFMYVYWR